MLCDLPYAIRKYWSSCLSIFDNCPLAFDNTNCSIHFKWIIFFLPTFLRFKVPRARWVFTVRSDKFKYRAVCLVVNQGVLLCFIVLSFINIEKTKKIRLYYFGESSLDFTKKFARSYIVERLLVGFLSYINF